MRRCCTSSQEEGGGWPYAGLTFDTAGNLYGTTALGGNLNHKRNGWGCRVVFQAVTEFNWRMVGDSAASLHRPSGRFSGGSA
jgi:hypothetical protein